MEKFSMKLAAIALFLVSTPAMAQHVHFQPQVKSLRCLKPQTRAVVSTLVRTLGPITITSTCGGRHARHSRHYSGQAFDWRPPHGVSYGRAVKAALSIRGTGVGTYRAGFIHTDTGR